MSLSAVPQELRALKQWVRWKNVPDQGGKSRKIPWRPDVSSAAKSNDPETWGTYETAVANLGKHGTQATSGFVFAEHNGLLGIDLDNCVVDGELTPFARKLVTEFQTYAEYSQSGKGIHLIGRAVLNRSGIKRAVGQGKDAVECYTVGRYFVTTGRHVAGAPLALNDCQAALDALVGQLDREEKERLERQLVPIVPGTPAPAPVPARPIADPEDVAATTGSWSYLERARAYVATMPAAISGQDGHGATWKVAIALKGFRLTQGEAMGLMREYNTRCEPPWSENDLEHKLEDAWDKARVPAGHIV